MAQRLQAVAATDGLELKGADLDTIANIHLANGRFDDAVRAVERAMAYDDGTGAEEADSRAEYLLTLAVARRGHGDQESAQACLGACRDLSEKREPGDVLVRWRQEQAAPTGSKPHPPAPPTSPTRPDKPTVDHTT